MNTLVKLRRTLGYTQDDVERLTGIDTSSLSFYENGLRVLSVKNAKKLGELYGVSWTKFFEDGAENDKTGVGAKASETN